LCNVASCWIYIGILLGSYPILHISRIRVKLNVRKAGFSSPDSLRLSLGRLTGNFPYSLGILTITLDFYWRMGKTVLVVSL
jgi:hypothetical protein